MALFGHSKDDFKEDERSAGSMFGPKMGTWTVHSDSDSRWNGSGRAYGLVCGGGPHEMHVWIERCQEKYGDPPDDLWISFWKD